MKFVSIMWVIYKIKILSYNIMYFFNQIFNYYFKF